MMRTAPLLLLAAGCAVNPGTLRQENPPLVYKSRQAPPQAAACVARNMERFLWAGSAAVAPMSTPGGLEVLATGVDRSVYALAEIELSGAETTVSLWFSPILRMLRGPQETGMKFMLGC